MRQPGIGSMDLIGRVSTWSCYAIEKMMEEPDCRRSMGQVGVQIEYGSILQG